MSSLSVNADENSMPDTHVSLASWVILEDSASDKVPDFRIKDENRRVFMADRSSSMAGK